MSFQVFVQSKKMEPEIPTKSHSKVPLICFEDKESLSLIKLYAWLVYYSLLDSSSLV